MGEMKCAISITANLGTLPVGTSFKDPHSELRFRIKVTNDNGSVLAKAEEDGWFGLKNSKQTWGECKRAFQRGDVFRFASDTEVVLAQYRLGQIPAALNDLPGITMEQEVEAEVA